MPLGSWCYSNVLNRSVPHISISFIWLSKEFLMQKYIENKKKITSEACNTIYQDEGAYHQHGGRRKGVSVMTRFYSLKAFCVICNC